MQTAVPDLPTWTGIRAWIDEAEATQKRTGSACHISCAQLLALSQFANFFEEPEMSTEEDHVTKLIGLAQRRGLGFPTFAMYEAIQVPIQGVFRPRWRCRCVLESGQTFPRPRKEKLPALFTDKKVRLPPSSVIAKVKCLSPETESGAICGIRSVVLSTRLGRGSVTPDAGTQATSPTTTASIIATAGTEKTASRTQSSVSRLEGHASRKAAYPPIRQALAPIIKLLLFWRHPTPLRRAALQRPDSIFVF
ncbi:hypothetical protein ISF_09725 [Cordyceps fumosorosea ARSEF 2679]|uniref:Uncharacterized protein n=1 Tax=Cordyceps fumosorosea (strain ARSEF 2679) TaxID=1081104 RepID=A0A162HRR9_CORFA|nr:hypothetical protein ISF_09725 [Cordyceps fumosorosea ARSEF 2679]OAA42285.1 hypothetical protein ISF_09725 [Cordyceps fumosorosea ARSEF 2679]